MASPKVNIVISELNKLVEATMVALALEILANLIASPARGGTPADTGWARANWVPNVGEPITEPIGRPPKRGEQLSAEARTARAKGEALLLRYKLGQGPINITNNAPYIGRLNQGWSTQAPAGFIQAAVARATKTINQRRRR